MRSFTFNITHPENIVQSVSIATPIQMINLTTFGDNLKITGHTVFISIAKTTL